MVLPNAKPPPAQTATRAAEILARPMSSLPGADSEASGARGVAIALLIEAGAVLSSSLDPATTMDQVARLIVPRLADLCVVDLLEDDGSIRGAAVAARDEAVVAELEQLHERHPMDPDGDHPAARVIRTGEPILMPQIPDTLLASYAEGSARARFVVAHEFRSAAVAPLVARDRTLGSVSILRLGNRAPYDAEDLVLVCELARRAALAIDNARLYAHARGVEQRLDAVLAGLAEAVTVVDRDGRTIFANRAAADLLGVESVDDVVNAAPGAILSRFLVTDEHGNQLDLEAMPARRLLAGKDAAPLLVRNVVRATGEERWLIVRASAITDLRDGTIAYAVNVFENVTEMKRAQLAERFMARASQLLASSMDYAETLEQIAHLAVPQLADWCAVDVLDERGELERVAVHHSDPAKLAVAEELHRRYRSELDESRGLMAVIGSGEPLLATNIAADALSAYARDSEHLAMLEAIAPRSVIVVPIAGPTRALGAITLLSSAESERQLTQADVDLAVRLGRRAGTAVENSRLYTERSRIAQTLQRALLPEALPEVPHVELAASYSAAGELNEVGRRLLRRLRLRRRQLDPGDRRRVRQGRARGPTHRDGPAHASCGGEQRSDADLDARNPEPRTHPGAGPGAVHRLPREVDAEPRPCPGHGHAGRTPAAAAHRSARGRDGGRTARHDARSHRFAERHRDARHDRRRSGPAPVHRRCHRGRAGEPRAR